MRIKLITPIIFITYLLSSCADNAKEENVEVNVDPNTIVLQAEDNSSTDGKAESENGSVSMDSTMNSIDFDLEIMEAGRYQVEIFAQSISDTSIVWIEDYIDNKDDRHYNITGNLALVQSDEEMNSISVDGSPLNAGLHKIRVHLHKGNASVDRIEFRLLKKHQLTPKVFEQNMEGEEWELVWSDEFEGEGLPDTTKWTYDIGNWGWGNFEPQYYTEGRLENARLEDGTLVIEAFKNDMGYPWTSARLTTRGKQTFLYGRIEFKAKVPPNRGNWAAGWTLGDEYVDELSWPYCGEIDILESVGYEMDDETGSGVAHASVHCGAYYFKLGNQPTAVVDVDSMYQKFHTYSIDWSPEGITASVDGEVYFEYTDTSNELAWPFDKPQNIILNLAMGGGWGGLQGMDPEMTSQKMVLDYVRVYAKK